MRFKFVANCFYDSSFQIPNFISRLWRSTDTIRTGPNPRRMASAGNRIWVADDRGVSAIDIGSGAVTALQFQDMAQQLAGHAARRIEVLERITGPLARLPEASADELGEAVQGTVHERIDGPVEQACMDGGSVELF